MTMTSVNKKAALLLFLLERTQALAQSIMLTVHKGWACNRVLGGINKLALSPWGEKLNTQMDVPLSFKHQQLSLRDPFSGELLRSPAVSCELVCRLLALYLAQVRSEQLSLGNEQHLVAFVSSLWSLWGASRCICSPPLSASSSAVEHSFYKPCKCWSSVLLAGDYFFLRPPPFPPLPL